MQEKPWKGMRAKKRRRKKRNRKKVSEREGVLGESMQSLSAGTALTAQQTVDLRCPVDG